MSFNNCGKVIKGNIKLLSEVYLLFIRETYIKGLSLSFTRKIIYNRAGICIKDLS
jgi:hypothetical protein